MLYQYFIHFNIIQQALVVSLLACVLTIFFGQKTINILYSLKIGQPVRFTHSPKLSELHEKKTATPTMGGALSLILFTILALFFFDWTNPTAWIFSSCYLLLGVLGVCDDLQKLKGSYAKGISSKGKFLLQLCIGIFAIVLTYILDKELFFAIFQRSFFSGCTICGLIFFLFVFCGSSNAVNLTDGLDGLAAGNIAIVSFGLLSIILINSTEFIMHYNSVIALALLIGLSIGFLWFNHFPAQMFMGDTGSLSYGGLLGCIAFFMKKEWIYATIGMVFVIEALSVILQVISFRYFNKKRIFLCSPIHHHFQYQGMHEVKIVTRFWIASIILVLLVLSFYAGCL